MKIKHIFLLTIFIFCIVACRTSNTNFSFSNLNPDSDITNIPVNASYEMYSWQTEAKTWAFLVFENGTKITSSFKDISQDPNTIIGEENLYSFFQERARGTKIYWNLKNIKGCTLPDEQTTKEILKIAKEKGIIIEIIPHF